MKLDGEFVFDASVQDVWDALFDPQVLAAVLPGCEKLELVDGQYVGEIKVKVGPIQGKFTGKVDLLDKIEPRSYKMKIDGRGAQGFVNATANIELVAEGDGTRIKYTSESNIGGKIASVGSRLVETSAKAIVKQSLEGLNENIKLRVVAYREHADKLAKEASSAAVESNPAGANPADVKAVANPAATVKTADAKPADAKPADAKPADATPADAKPEDAKPAGAEPADAKPGENPATMDVKPADTKPADTKPVDAKPADAKPADARPVDVTREPMAKREPEAKSAPEPEANAEPSKPVVAYKKADVGKLGAAVAKEVGKSMAPYLAVAALVIGVVLYLLLR